MLLDVIVLCAVAYGAFKLGNKYGTLKEVFQAIVHKLEGDK